MEVKFGRRLANTFIYDFLCRLWDSSNFSGVNAFSMNHGFRYFAVIIYHELFEYFRIIEAQREVSPWVPYDLYPPVCVGD